MARATSKLINKQNKITILNTVRQEGAISRADISKKTKISAPTVTRIIEDLISEDNLVKDIGEGDSSGGRRPNLVSFAGEKHYVIGIDLSPRYISGILTDLNSKIISEIKVLTSPGEGFEKIIERTGSLIGVLINQAQIDESKIKGVGLGVAGFIDMQNQVLLRSPNFGWENVNPQKELQKYTDFPIVYDNLTRVMALGELHYGAGSEYDDFVCLKLGMGVGAGVIIDRKPFYGSHGCGSESGHSIIDLNSNIQCTCGNRGCFEALASGNYILSRMKDENLSLDNDPLANAIQLIQENPEKFKDLVDDLVLHLSIGILNQIHTYDPQAIVLGGHISELGSVLLEPVKEKVLSMIIPHFQTDIDIRIVEYGEKAVSMGAVALVLDKILQLEI